MYSTDIFTALNVSAITSLLGMYTDSAGNYVSALINGVTVPETCEAKNTINFYQLGTIDCRLDYGLARYTVNCRAETQNEALTIAKAVIDTVNMESFTTYRLYCQLGQPIQPQDSTDVFNVPIEITIKRK